MRYSDDDPAGYTLPDERSDAGASLFRFPGTPPQPEDDSKRTAELAQAVLRQMVFAFDNYRTPEVAQLLQAIPPEKLLEKEHRLRFLVG